MGIFALLDEESRFPKASDQSLAIKLHQTLSPLFSDVYVAPKNIGASFSIVHYAGQVILITISEISYSSAILKHKL